MTEPASQRRLCPTRSNGAHTLIAHWITPDTCLARQRQGYHKCFACAYRGLAAGAVLPAARATTPEDEPSSETRA